jgi:hypothetical protein
MHPDIRNPAHAPGVEARVSEPAGSLSGLPGAVVLAAAEGVSPKMGRLWSMARGAGSWLLDRGRAAADLGQRAVQAYQDLPQAARVGIETIGAAGLMLTTGVAPVVALQVVGAAQAAFGSYRDEPARAAVGVGAVLAAAAAPEAAGSVVELVGDGMAALAGGAVALASSAAAVAAPTAALAAAVAVACPETTAAIREATSVARELNQALGTIQIDDYQISQPRTARPPALSVEQLQSEQRRLWNQILNQSALTAAIFATVGANAPAVEAEDVFDCLKSAAAGYEDWDGWRQEQNRHADPALPEPSKIAGWASLTEGQRKAQLFERCQSLVDQMLERKHHLGWAKRQVASVTFRLVHVMAQRILERFSEKLLPSVQRLGQPEGMAQVVQILQVAVKGLAEKISHYQNVTEALAVGHQYVDEVTGACIDAQSVPEALERILSGSSFNAGLSAQERARLTQDYLLQDWLPDLFKPSTGVAQFHGKMRRLSGPWWKQLGQILRYLLLAPVLAMAWVVCRGLEMVINPILRSIIHRQLQGGDVLQRGLEELKKMLVPGLSREVAPGRTTQMSVSMTRGMTNMLHTISWKLHELAKNPPMMKSLEQRQAKRHLNDAMHSHARNLVRGLLKILPLQEAQTPEELREALDGPQPESLGRAAEFVRRYFGRSIDGEVNEAIAGQSAEALEKLVDFLLEDESLILSCVNSGLESMAAVFDHTQGEPLPAEVQQLDARFDEALTETQRHLGVLASAIVLRNPSFEKRHELRLVAQFTEEPSAAVEGLASGQTISQSLEQARRGLISPAEARAAQQAVELHHVRWSMDLANANDLFDQLSSMAETHLRAETAEEAAAAEAGRQSNRYLLQRAQQLLASAGHVQASNRVAEAIAKEQDFSLEELNRALNQSREQLGRLAELHGALDGAANGDPAALERWIEQMSIRTLELEQQHMALAQKTSIDWLDRYRSYRVEGLCQEIAHDLSNELAANDPRAAELPNLLQQIRLRAGDLNVFARGSRIGLSLEQALDNLHASAEEFDRQFDIARPLPACHQPVLDYAEQVIAQIRDLLEIREGLGAAPEQIEQLSALRQQLQRMVQTLKTTAQTYTMKDLALWRSQGRRENLAQKISAFLTSQETDGRKRANLHAFDLIGSCLRSLPLSAGDQRALSEDVNWKALVDLQRGNPIPGDARGLFERLMAAHGTRLRRHPDAQIKLSALQRSLARPLPHFDRERARRVLLEALRPLALSPRAEVRHTLEQSAREIWQTLTAADAAPQDLAKQRLWLSSILAHGEQKAAQFRTQSALVWRSEDGITQIRAQLTRCAEQIRQQARAMAGNSETRAAQTFAQRAYAAASHLCAANVRLQDLVASLPEPGLYRFERERLPSQVPVIGGRPAQPFFRALARQISPEGASEEQQKEHLRRTLFGVIGATIGAGASRRIRPVLSMAHNRPLISAALDTGLTLVSQYHAERSHARPQAAPHVNAARQALPRRRPVRRART